MTYHLFPDLLTSHSTHDHMTCCSHCLDTTPDTTAVSADAAHYLAMGPLLRADGDILCSFHPGIFSPSPNPSPSPEYVLNGNFCAAKCRALLTSPA